MKLKRSKAYTAAAFLVAPLPVAFLMSLGTPVTNDGPITPLGMLNNDIGALFGLTVVLYFYALPISALLALPMFTLLRRFNLVRWWSAMLSGLTIGLLCSMAFTNGLPINGQELANHLVWGAMGAIGAMVFWLIWRKGQNVPVEA